MDLSIIIVNWNTRGLLENCLKAVYRKVHHLSFEVIVVDNASEDGSVEMVCSDFPHVKLIVNRENVGFARANNQAIRKSVGNNILLLNSDAFLQEKAAKKMVDFLDKTPSAGIVGANLCYPDGRPQLSHSPFPSLRWEIASLLGLDKLHNIGPHKVGQLVAGEAVETGTVTGACLMVRRGVLDQIGLLDENFYFFSEEVDLCYRAHQTGWKVYHLPIAHVIHVGGGSTGITPRRYLMLYQEKLRYFAKHYGSFTWALLLGAIWFTTLVKLAGFRLLRWVSLGRIRRDELWLGVVKGLAQFRV